MAPSLLIDPEVAASSLMDAFAALKAAIDELERDEKYHPEEDLDTVIVSLMAHISTLRTELVYVIYRYLQPLIIIDLYLSSCERFSGI